MDMLLMLESPVLPEDIYKIEKLNNSIRSIVSPFTEDEFDCYATKSYLFQSRGFDHNIYCILDSNITTEIAGLATVKDLAQEAARNALILLTFLQLAEVDIDPSISISEYNTTSKSPDAIQRLHNFRLIDNLPPEHLVDIVLGRASQIDISLSRYNQQPHYFYPYEFANEVPHWEMYYTFALKIFLVANTNKTRKEKIKEFISWIWSDFLFSATAITFAFVFFSDSYGKMLKGVKSKNIEKVMKGIKNATWDMSIVSYWSEKNVKRNVTEPHYIFCTKDKALREVAILLLGQTGIDCKKERLRYIMGSSLGKRDISEIIEHHDDLESKIECKTRKINSVPNRRKYFEKCIVLLEKEVQEFI